MIEIVTMTGADDSTHIQDMLDLSHDYPFVEWGILFSRNSAGKPRYPSHEWLKCLLHEAPGTMKLSAHLCGSIVREFISGKTAFIEELRAYWPMFNRVQINFHSIPHDMTHGIVSNMGLIGELNGYNKNLLLKEFIFQYDDVNNDVVNMAVKRYPKCSILFDRSGGAGILPKEWPDMLPETKCGYAGGLGPQNIIEQIDLIKDKVGERDSWIDMETHVRSKDDTIFDMKKVEFCLKASEPYIKNEV